MSDFEKKTLRHFYCRDGVWQSFERMSEELDRGIDDLVNDAMGFYLREKGFAVADSSVRSTPVRGPAPVQNQALTVPGLPSRMPAAAPPAPARAPVPAPPARIPAAAPRVPVMQPLPGAPVMAAPSGATPVPPPLPPPRASAARAAVPSQPPPPPRSGLSEAPAPPLYLVFDSKKYKIDKDQFIIGRGVKSSDLAIRDSNISRKHVAVVRRNGAYFIKDLGSTNGIDFNGSRVDNRRIEEGDVYFLCDYELRFTFQ